VWQPMRSDLDSSGRRPSGVVGWWPCVGHVLRAVETYRSLLPVSWASSPCIEIHPTSRTVLTLYIPLQWRRLQQIDRWRVRFVFVAVNSLHQTQGVGFVMDGRVHFGCVAVRDILQRCYAGHWEVVILVTKTEMVDCCPIGVISRI
jgi:hypothetical protein